MKTAIQVIFTACTVWSVVESNAQELSLSACRHTLNVLFEERADGHLKVYVPRLLELMLT